MTKLEELTALLVNEINDFKKGVEKLEQINNQLKDTKIKMDLTEYKSIIETHQKQMTTHLNAIERFENRFENQLKTAKIYPNWAVIVFIITFLFGVVSTSYVFILKQDTYSLEKEAYQKGVIDTNNYIQTFFKKYPKSKKAFEYWKEKVE